MPRAELLREARLDEEQLRDPDARVPRAALVRLWHAVASHVPDPALGLHLGTAVRAREFGLVGYTMAVSPTVAAARQRLTRYEGTRLGRQELYAELLEDTPGALWTRALLEQTRVRTLPPLRRIAIGLDPGGEAGIVVAALGDDGQAYVLEDMSMSGSPATWAGQAIAGYHKYKANMIVAERNHGGEMVQQTLATQDATVAVKVVWASQGKYARAEPISALYEKERVHHVGMFAELEDQMCNWVPGEGLPSPNELDALVWALTELLLQGEAPLPPIDLARTLLGTQKPGAFRGGTSGPRPHLGGRRWADEEDEY